MAVAEAGAAGAQHCAPNAHTAARGGGLRSSMRTLWEHTSDSWILFFSCGEDESCPGAGRRHTCHFYFYGNPLATELVVSRSTSAAAIRAHHAPRAAAHAREIWVRLSEMRDVSAFQATRILPLCQDPFVTRLSPPPMRLSSPCRAWRRPSPSARPCTARRPRTREIGARLREMVCEMQFQEDPHFASCQQSQIKHRI